MFRSIRLAATHRAAPGRFALLFLGLACFASGCTFWHNFSTYFNTIYLARTHLEAYEDQQKEIKTSTNSSVAILNHRWLDEEYQSRQLAIEEGTEVPIPPTFSRTLSATKQVSNVHLDSAIILGSKVLASKKSTKYIEDALYIVGKAQFYKNDFGGARRKFLELLYQYPDTKYGADVRVLLSRSMLANHQLDTASQALAVALDLAQKNGDKSALADVHRATAEYIYAKNPDSLAAIATELRAAEDGLSGNEKSQVAYEEGAVDYLNSDWNAAEHAFQVAYQAANDDWLIGEAHIGHALALRKMQQFPEARAELKMVAEKVKFSGSNAAAKYELAYTDELAARAQVKNDLHGDLFKTTYHEPLNKEYFVLDTSFRNSSAVIISRARYRQAEMFREMGEYDSASRIATTLIGTKDFSTPAMNELVNNRMRSLASFSKWRSELVRIDSLERVVESHHPSLQGRNLQTERHMQALKETLGGAWRPEMPVRLTSSDSARLKVIEARLEREGTQKKVMVIHDTADYVDSLNYLATNAHYQLGHAFETFDELPHARDEYRSALGYEFSTQDPETDSLQAQVLYAWAQLERREKNLVAADSLLQQLYAHYGQTVFAEQARKLFASNDRSSKGEAAYAEAYHVLATSGIDAAKPKLLAIAENFPHEDVAPRSYYAVGVSYEEIPHYDSAVVYYRKVLDNYPYSSYAEALRPRLPIAAAAIPKRPDPNVSLTDEDKQKAAVEQARKAREEQIKREQQSMPGLPQNDNPPTEINAGSDPVPPGQPAPPSINVQRKPTPPPPKSK